jgi:poly(A) polymerase
MKRLEEILAQAVRGTEFAGKVYLVGGYVRDAVMGIPSNDLDVVVALPQGGLRFARHLTELGVARNLVVFERFGTAAVQIGKYTVECVMTRKESYRPQDRKPDVAMGSLREDVYRRDFTINALLKPVDGDEIVDITGKGISDIQAGIIRSTSEPKLIFCEDPLRILRAVRFAAQLGFRIEAHTAAGMHHNHATLATISWERRRDELSKLLLSSDPLLGLHLLQKFNLVAHLVPQWNAREKPHWLTSEALVAVPHSIAARLAVFLLLGSKLDARSYRTILAQLRYSNEQAATVVSFAQQLCILWPALLQDALNEGGIRRILFYQRHLAEPLAIVQAWQRWAHRDATAILHQISQVQDEFVNRQPPVNGSDIKHTFGIKRGARVGELLHQATEMWLDNPALSKNEILAEIQKQER